MPTPLLEQRQALLDQATQIKQAAQADGDRPLTDPELDQLKTVLDQVDGLDERIARSKRSQALFDGLSKLDHELTEDAPGAFPLKSRINVAGLAPRAFAALKAPVASGSTVVEVELLPGIIPAGREPLTLLDAIPGVRRQSAVYRYLRETVRTPNASVVAPGAVKPTSAFTIASVDSYLRVVATLSEPLDRFVLEDAPALRQFLDSELVDAVERAIETEILSGDGTGEHFLGLNHLSGVQTATGTDLLSGLRASITKLQGVSVPPSFFIVNPTDLETAQTTRNASGGFDWAPDQPIDAGRSQAWGFPLIPVAAVPANTAWAIGQDSLQLSTDGVVRLDVGTPGDTFTKNQFVLRAETRANLDALRPFGVPCPVLRDAAQGVSPRGRPEGWPR